MTNKLASFENDIDFPRLWRIGFAISGVMLLLSVGALFGRGPGKHRDISLTHLISRRATVPGL